MALILTLSVTLAITGAASFGCFWLRETEINNLTERLRAARAREQSTAHAYANLLRETTAARGLVFENMVLREQLGRSRQAQEVLRERLREGAEAPVSGGGSPSTGEIEIIDRLTVASPFEPPFTFPTDFLVSAILIFFVFSLLIYVVIRAAKNLLCTNHFVRIH